MKLAIRTIALGGIAAIALTAMTTGADAKVWKLTAASSHPPIVPWVQVITKFVVPQSNIRLKEIGSPHSIKWTEAYAGALYNFKNTLEGVQDGLTDIGWVGTLWEPVKMPLHNVQFYAPFASGNVQHLNAIQEELETTIPAMKAEWDKHNQVYLGAQVADTYHIVSTYPINSLADLKGKKFMTPGAIANWLKGTGAIGINGGLPVYYNNMKTGVADGAIIITTGMLPFKLHEAAPYITKIDLGGPMSGALTMNKDTWKKLPTHMKLLFRDLGREYAQQQTNIIEGKVSLFMKIMAKQGAKITTLPASERQKWVNSMPDLAGDWVKANGAAGKQVLSAFMNGIRKRGGKPARDWDK
jgi:TRAP-type C4-dicarboxylate transport system substrate-binding protein